MNSHITLLVGLIQTLPFRELPKFCTLPLINADVSLMAFVQGQILKQAVSHHLLHVELFEFVLSGTTSIDLTINAPSYFLFATQGGRLILSDDTGEIINETSGSKCQLCYFIKGRYKITLCAGQQKLLLLNIRPEWLARKGQEIPEIQTLLTQSVQYAERNFSLPGCGIANSLFKLLYKMNFKVNRSNMEIKFHAFIDRCISSYSKKLKAKNTIIKVHREKAMEIEAFVRQNYTSKIVDDESALARYFTMSEIGLTRLAKLAFGKPLHKQVMELRLLKSRDLIASTQRPINDIAVSVGYNDPHYFSRAFKKRFGICPTKIRTN